MRMEAYQLGEIVIEEGSPSAYLVYIIIEGEAALCKSGLFPPNRPLEYKIEVRGKNEIFGWVSVLDGSLLAGDGDGKNASHRCHPGFDETGRPRILRHLRNVLIAELRHYSSSFARTFIENRVAILQHQAEFARYRSAVGTIVITALALLSFYTLALTMLGVLNAISKRILCSGLSSSSSSRPFSSR
jgi:hypothetical protein